jgi:hypothetical protein
LPDWSGDGFNRREKIIRQLRCEVADKVHDYAHPGRVAHAADHESPYCCALRSRLASEIPDKGAVQELIATVV